MYGVPILQRKPQYLSVKRTEQGSVAKTQWELGYINAKNKKKRN